MNRRFTHAPINEAKVRRARRPAKDGLLFPPLTAFSKGTEKQKYLNAYIRLCIYKSTKTGVAVRHYRCPTVATLLLPSCRCSFHPIGSTRLRSVLPLTIPKSCPQSTMLPRPPAPIAFKAFPGCESTLQRMWWPTKFKPAQSTPN